MSPATKALPPTASLVISTAVLFNFSISFSSPNCFSFSRFALNVGAYIICEPASRYAFLISFVISGCSKTQRLSEAESGMPCAASSVPVAPSRIVTLLSFTNFANSSFFIILFLTPFTNFLTRFIIHQFCLLKF